MIAINKIRFSAFKKNNEMIMASMLKTRIILKKSLPDLSSSFVKFAKSNPQG